MRMALAGAVPTAASAPAVTAVGEVIGLSSTISAYRTEGVE
jgi:hypothetical protein